MFASTELGARIERAECGLLTDCAAAIQRSRPAEDVRVLRIAGGVATYAGPDSPLNKVAGLGFAGPVDETELDTDAAELAGGISLQLIEFNAIEIARVGIELVEHAAQSTAHQALLVDLVDVACLHLPKHLAQGARHGRVVASDPEHAVATEQVEIALARVVPQIGARRPDVAAIEPDGLEHLDHLGVQVALVQAEHVRTPLVDEVVQVHEYLSKDSAVDRARRKPGPGHGILLQYTRLSALPDPRRETSPWNFRS